MRRPTAPPALLTILALASSLSAGCDEPPAARAFTASPKKLYARPAPLNPCADPAAAGCAQVTPSAPAPLLGVQFPRTKADCAMRRVDLRMNWSECDPEMDCFVNHEQGYPEVTLRTPTSGPMVLEAHLMTDQDDLGGFWPSHGRHGISEHYKTAEAVSGYVMDRKQPWAPAGEGGCEYGQGSALNAVPVVAETWYVNMHWRTRPEPGTRLIVKNPRNGRAVVAAGGYETGPGSNTALGGASEEIHHYLGTTHRDSLIMGFAVDQSLPYGPVDCP